MVTNSWAGILCFATTMADGASHQTKKHKRSDDDVADSAPTSHSVEGAGAGAGAGVAVPRGVTGSAAAPLAGKSAIVTGSTSGIGLGIATVLASKGASIVLNGFGDPSDAMAAVQAAADAAGAGTPSSTPHCKRGNGGTFGGGSV